MRYLRFAVSSKLADLSHTHNCIRKLLRSESEDSTSQNFLRETALPEPACRQRQGLRLAVGLALKLARSTLAYVTLALVILSLFEPFFDLIEAKFPF